ncbi:uncharacterized protein NEMAJ01_0485 [Nematocida major]|uniref:uncharacterized protein n=1 Tax=Nematocida major TaxID=1912982 RepID=UPI00200771E7|nr:uncharacterized protein NEMAJ01_0485 [Nematocida major]KAH9385589.1 hypothetical protein NEMAJ01_0485 [Nematocida major]
MQRPFDSEGELDGKYLFVPQNERNPHNVFTSYKTAINTTAKQIKKGFSDIETSFSQFETRSSKITRGAAQNDPNAEDDRLPESPGLQEKKEEKNGQSIFFRVFTNGVSQTLFEFICNIERTFTLNDHSFLTGMFLVLMAVLFELLVYCVFTLYMPIMYVLGAIIVIRYSITRTVSDYVIVMCIMGILSIVMILGAFNAIWYILCILYIILTIKWVGDASMHTRYSDIVLLSVVVLSSISLSLMSYWGDRMVNSVYWYAYMQAALYVFVLFNAGTLRYLYNWIKYALVGNINRKEGQTSRRNHTQGNIMREQYEEQPPRPEPAQKSARLASLFKFGTFWNLVILSYSFITGFIVFVGILHAHQSVAAYAMRTQRYNVSMW